MRRAPDRTLSRGHCHPVPVRLPRPALLALLAVPACEQPPAPDLDPDPPGYDTSCSDWIGSVSVYPDGVVGVVRVQLCTNDAPVGTGVSCSGRETLFDAHGTPVEPRHTSDCGHHVVPAGLDAVRVEDWTLHLDPFGRDRGWGAHVGDWIPGLGVHPSGMNAVIGETGGSRVVELRDREGNGLVSVVPTERSFPEDVAWPDPDGPAIVVGTGPVEAFALSPDGKVPWAVDIPELHDPHLVEPAPGGGVYVGDHARIARLGPDGGTDPTFSMDAAPLENMVSLARLEDGVCALDGETVWCFEGDGSLRFVNVPAAPTDEAALRSHEHYPRQYPRTFLRALPDGRLATATETTLRVIDRDGAVDWEADVASP
jgi:hypothetical protein